MMNTLSHRTKITVLSVIGIGIAIVTMFILVTIGVKPHDPLAGVPVPFVPTENDASLAGSLTTIGNRTINASTVAVKKVTFDTGTPAGTSPETLADDTIYLFDTTGLSCVSEGAPLSSVFFAPTNTLLYGYRYTPTLTEKNLFIQSKSTPLPLNQIYTGNFFTSPTQAAYTVNNINDINSFSQTHGVTFAGWDDITLEKNRTYVVVANTNNISAQACGLQWCGDGVIKDVAQGGNEQCDDHNRTNNDGCSKTCTIEAGYSCPAPGQACVRLCGNGQQDFGEFCDDGNQNNGDGCSTSCAVEAGFNCMNFGAACIRQCGNSMMDMGETCDDGNANSGDGCSASCSIESGYSCMQTGSACVRLCGNGMKEGSETCDDGNANSGDGCSNSCQTEAGYACDNQMPNQCSLFVPFGS